MHALEDQSISTGARLFVDSATGTDAAGYGNSPDAPLATLDYAIGLCTANKGDIIYLMPGHAETLVAAATLTMDVAGVKVVGLGWGTLRPTFTITTHVAATFNITAANCWLENVRIVSNFLNIAAAMTIGASADGLTLKDVEFKDTSVILGSLIGISIAAGVSDVTIDGLRYNGLALTAASTSGIVLAGEANRFRLTNSYIKGDFSTGVITATAAASIDINLLNLYLINMSETGKGIDLHASTTGFADNVMAYLEDHTGNEKAITGAALFMTDRVRQTNVVGASPILCLAADS
jgi:hypothetical protein